MAEKQEHRTKPKDRVRIKDSVTHMYPNARVYNEGFVRERTHDSLGYPLIYVEWDKDHWAYSGEEDRWALEAHFDLVEDKEMADEKPDFIQGLKKLIEQYEGEQGQNAAPEPAPDPRPTNEPTYDEILSKATDAARDGEAFIILVASPENYRGLDMVVPRAYMHSKRDDAAMLLDAQMADLVAQSMARMTQEIVKVLKDHDTPGS